MDPILHAWLALTFGSGAPIPGDDPEGKELLARIREVRQHLKPLEPVAQAVRRQDVATAEEVSAEERAVALARKGAELANEYRALADEHGYPGEDLAEVLACLALCEQVLGIEPEQ